ncbi:MAG: RepB family DNA primase, partial [Desulfovibrio sp.]
NIYYTPLSENLHHILIDDMTAEKLVQLQKDGFRPAAIIESSPGNFQCILTFAKFGNAFDRQIANRLTVLLNRKYGDPKLSGAIHPHRAPGFENRKEKHRRKDSTFPQSVLRYAVRQDCQKTLVEARKIELELKKQAEAKATKPVVYQPISNMGAESAYFAHYADIRAHITIEDYSRVDAMIALRMRANGHSPEAVTAAILTCAPQIRAENQRRRDWQRYADRTMNYAFGYAGDRDLMRNERYRELWRRIEGIEVIKTLQLRSGLK